jgi:hypothetical protein
MSFGRIDIQSVYPSDLYLPLRVAMWEKPDEYFVFHADCIEVLELVAKRITRSDIEAVAHKLHWPRDDGLGHR